MLPLIVQLVLTGVGFGVDTHERHSPRLADVARLWASRCEYCPAYLRL